MTEFFTQDRDGHNNRRNHSRSPGRKLVRLYFFLVNVTLTSKDVHFRTKLMQDRRVHDHDDHYPPSQPRGRSRSRASPSFDSSEVDSGRPPKQNSRRSRSPSRSRDGSHRESHTSRKRKEREESRERSPSQDRHKRRREKERRKEKEERRSVLTGKKVCSTGSFQVLFD